MAMKKRKLFLGRRQNAWSGSTRVSIQIPLAVHTLTFSTFSMSDLSLQSMLVKQLHLKCSEKYFRSPTVGLPTTSKLPFFKSLISKFFGFN